MDEGDDQAFARVALRLGYLRPDQAAHALAWRRNRPEAPDLASLCIAYGVLTPNRVREVQELVRVESAGSSSRPGRREALEAFLRGAAASVTGVASVASELAALLEKGSIRLPPVPTIVELERTSGSVFALLGEATRERLEAHARAAASTKGAARSRALRELAAGLEAVMASAPTFVRTAFDDGSLAPDEGQVVFTIEDGPDTGRVFSFPAGGDASFVVGRAGDVKVCLANDAKVSRQHCLVTVCGPRAIVRDLSKNGTSVNGEKIVEEAEVASGAEISVGRTTLRLDLPAAMPTPAGPSRAASERLAAVGGAPNFPDLTVLDVIGEGGQGVVYRAKRASGEIVAVKTLRPDRKVRDTDVGRFLREASLGQSIQHPNVVRVLGSGFHANVFYFVMEHVSGLDIERELAQRGRPFSPAKGIAVLRQVLGGVKAAHDRGLVHRDIKPSNILLEDIAGGGFIPKLTDFGLMRSFEGAGLSFTKTGQGRGTPAFMPPEQVEHAHLASPVSDIYALGATLYYLITRQFPLELKKGVHPLVTVLDPARVPLRKRLPTAPKALEDLISKCMAYVPADRFASVDELDAALEKVAAKLPKAGAS